jgi:hypothetical protein
MVVQTGPSGFTIAGRFLRLLPGLIRSGPTGLFTAGDLLERNVQRRGDAVFVRFEDRVCTYGEINALRLAIGNGLRPDLWETFQQRFGVVRIGFTSRQATEQKILHDVFAAGDAWFRTGDLLFCDADGFYYFVDRTGDTFRWKGENVSTQEVAEAVMAQPEVHLCAVYGVAVPGADGRAGMAAVVLEPGTRLSGETRFQRLQDALPGYARPAFVRRQQRADLTGTFKLRKVELQEQGFDSDASDDQILFRDDEHNAFRPLDSQGIARIDTQRPGLFVGTTEYMALRGGFLPSAIREHTGMMPRLLTHSDVMLSRFEDSLMNMGMVLANREVCRALMAAGESILVFQGGAREGAKRRGEQYQLFGEGRTGFVRMALEHGFTITPVTTVGPDEMCDIRWDSNSSISRRSSKANSVSRGPVD